MLSVALDVSGVASILGWPILPHGGGSYYNTFNNYIGNPPSSVTPAYGERFGEYMPQAGAIFGAAINWAYRYDAGRKYEIFASNYGPSGFVQINPPLADSITASTGGITTISSPPLPPGSLGESGSHSNWFSQPIRFVAGDYIGIYIWEVTGSTLPNSPIPDPFVVEGTIYFRFNNDGQTGQNSTPNPWSP
jgi:hypothetical protein